MGEKTERFAKSFADQYGFDFMAILTIIMSLLENCPKSVASQIKNPGPFARVRVNMAVAREVPELPVRQRRELSAKLMEEAAAEARKKLKPSVQSVAGGN